MPSNIEGNGDATIRGKGEKLPQKNTTLRRKK